MVGRAWGVNDVEGVAATLGDLAGTGGHVGWRGDGPGAGINTGDGQAAEEGEEQFASRFVASTLTGKEAWASLSCARK